MKIAVRTLLAAAALATIVRLPAQEAKRTLSLDEAIAVALTENPAMKAAEFEEKAATQERRAAIGLRMPKISVMGAYAYMSKDIGFDFNEMKGPAKELAGQILGSGTNVCAQVQPAIPSDARIEKKVESLLKKMTLEEKVGQMCEITIDVITDFNSPNDFKLSEALLDTVIGKYKVGSILNVPLSVAQTKEKWAETIRQIQEKSLQEIGIPCIYGVDQIHGTTYTLDGTLFPQGINMAATFNRPAQKESYSHVFLISCRIASCLIKKAFFYTALLLFLINFTHHTIEFQRRVFHLVFVIRLYELPGVFPVSIVN
mgnify:CR=1 FL=1